jgi:hypothetical protein
MMVSTVADFRAANGSGIRVFSHRRSAEDGPMIRMIRKLGSFVALAGAIVFACWNPAVAQTPSAPCLSIDGAASTCSSATTDASTTTGPSSDPYPRTMAFEIGGDFALLHSGDTNAGVPLATVASESNMIVINDYLGVEKEGTYASLMQSWKAAAAAHGLTLRTFLYTEGMASQYTLESGDYPWLANAFNKSSMWAYTSAAGRGTTDLVPYTDSGGAGSSYLQITSYNKQTVPSSYEYNGKTGVLAGYNVWNLHARYFYDVFVNGLARSKYGEVAGFVPNPYLDGIFLDNYPPVPPKTATWEGVGTTPVGATAATIAATQEGQAKEVAAFRSLNSKFLVLANTGFAAVYLNGTLGTVEPSYKNLWNAAMNEGAVGYGWSIETWDNSPPGHFMQGLIAAEESLASGGTLVFHQVGGPGGENDLTGDQSHWGATQWQAVRFGFAAAMQRNWHYALSCGQGEYGNVGLMDEQVQTVDGKANYGWLSAGTQRLDPPQSAAWSDGVWRRRFPNGWVLWNPRGNGARTVTIPSTLCRIKTRGYGNASVNDGKCGATSVTLQNGDGLFLIGTG